MRYLLLALMFLATPVLAEETQTIYYRLIADSGLANYDSLLSFNPESKIIFFDKGETIGELDFSKGKMIFKGDADKSAKRFFEYVVKEYIDSNQGKADEIITKIRLRQAELMQQASDEELRGILNMGMACEVIVNEVINNSKEGI